MSGRWRAVPALAWRDTRAARRRLLLFMSAISLGVAALVAVDSFSANVKESIREQSRGLLGADLALSSRDSLPPPVLELVDSLAAHGTRVARTTSFASMALVPGHAGTRLVQVRAVSPGAPFYGRIETSPAGRWAMLQQGPYALADSSLLIALDARIGDTLTLGYARFVILGTLRNVPGDVGVAAALGPRVYIPERLVPNTKLLTFGSRAEYQTLLAFPPGVVPAPIVAGHRALFDRAHVRPRTVDDTERSLTRGIDQLDRFLGLVGLIALLLGGIGVASAIHAYVVERMDTVAVLRCVGATSRQVLGIYLLEAAVLGLVGAAIGVALGVAAQLALPRVLGGFIPVDVHAAIAPAVLLTGLATGVWVALMFALLPILGVRRIAPLAVLRREVGGVPPRARWSDPARLVTLAALAGSLVMLAVSRTAEPQQGVMMSLGVGAAVLLLAGSAALVMRLARRVLRDAWPFTVRQGIANLHRPANQTRAVVLSLGFGAFLLGTLALVQASVMRELAVSGRAAQANLAFFDVQPEQAPTLDSLMHASGAPPTRIVPIVPMRIAAINGQSVADRSKARPTWALRREYRSSYRDTLVASEKLVAGRWTLDHGRGAPPYAVSLERGVAEELRVTVGDTITWDVQGVQIPTVVTSLREVNWARFEPNFFVIFEPAALREAPQTRVLMARVSDAAPRAALQRAAVERFPNVSTIDLSAIQSAVEGILGKVTLAVRFMALFSLATGVLVLVSAVASSRRQRVREGVLLKTLGATRAQIGRIMLAEYAVLGALGSVAGMVLAVAGAWALVHFVFEAPFVAALGPLVAIALGMMLLTSVIGVSAGRDVFRATPMEALREGA